MSAPDRSASSTTASTCPQCGTAAGPGARFCRACGADLGDAPTADLSNPPTGDPPAPVAPVAPLPDTARLPDTTAAVSAADSAPGAPRMRRSLRRRLLLLAAVVLVLGLVVGIVSVIQSTRYSPDRPVRAFFAAMQAHDGARLAQLSHCESSPLCASGALDTGYQAPEQVEITGVQYGAALPDDQTRRPDRGRAVVTVRYRLAGAVHTDRVSLSRAGTGLFRDWAIDTPPGAWLDVVSPRVAQARLAGASVDTVAQPSTGRSTDGAVWALPGVYTLSAVADPLFDAPPATLTVTGADRQSAQLAVTLKPSVLPAVDRQVRTRIDACARQADMDPTVDGGGCPMEYSSSFAFTRNVRWSVTKYPTLEIRLTDDGPQVHTTVPGTATIRYQWTTDVLEPREWSADTGSSPITVSGRVELVAGVPTWRE